MDLFVDRPVCISCLGHRWANRGAAQAVGCLRGAHATSIVGPVRRDCAIPGFASYGAGAACSTVHASEEPFHWEGRLACLSPTIKECYHGSGKV